MEVTVKADLVLTSHGEEGASSRSREVSQTEGLTALDFLLTKRLCVCSPSGPHCALLSGPPRSGKTSLLLQLAYNVASETPFNVVFICKPRNFESDFIYLAPDVDSSSEVFDRIHIKYVHDEEDLRKYFAAFHMHTSLPTTIIIDDFVDFFQGWDGRNQVGQARSSRDLVIVKTLCLAQDAITYASQRYETTTQCRLILSDSHHSDGPRLSYIFRRWVHQTFVIKEINLSSVAHSDYPAEEFCCRISAICFSGSFHSATHDSGFTLSVHDERGHGKACGVANYDLSQRYLRFDGWDGDS